MSYPLPRYTAEQFNQLDILSLHAKHFAKVYQSYGQAVRQFNNHLSLLSVYAKSCADAYQNYAAASEQLKIAHDLYYEKPELESREFAYRSALLNLKSAEASITEVKNFFFETQMQSWSI